MKLMIGAALGAAISSLLDAKRLLDPGSPEP